jgi:hypothetical protein
MSDSKDTAEPHDAASTQPARARPAREPIDAADMAEIARVVVARAKDGDMKAAEVARKTWRWPQPAVCIDLPPVTDAASLAQAHAAVIAEAAAGELSTRQALDFSTMLEYRRRAVETFEIETKIRELYEAKRKAGGGER